MPRKSFFITLWIGLGFLQEPSSRRHIKSNLTIKKSIIPGLKAEIIDYSVKVRFDKTTTNVHETN
jgi:hypothetical protein